MIDCFKKIECLDCKQETNPGEACEHCGCPLSEEAWINLMDGLSEIMEDLQESRG